MSDAPVIAPLITRALAVITPDGLRFNVETDDHPAPRVMRPELVAILTSELQQQTMGLYRATIVDKDRGIMQSVTHVLPLQSVGPAVLDPPIAVEIDENGIARPKEVEGNAEKLRPV